MIFPRKMIRRSVGTANTTTFSLLYKTLVRPLPEYAAPVWNPYLVKDIHAIESVQRRASRSVSYTHLTLPTKRIV